MHSLLSVLECSRAILALFVAWMRVHERAKLENKLRRELDIDMSRERRDCELQSRKAREGTARLEYCCEQVEIRAATANLSYIVFVHWARACQREFQEHEWVKRLQTVRDNLESEERGKALNNEAWNQRLELAERDRDRWELRAAREQNRLEQALILASRTRGMESAFAAWASVHGQTRWIEHLWLLEKERNLLRLEVEEHGAMIQPSQDAALLRLLLFEVFISWLRVSARRSKKDGCRAARDSERVALARQHV